MGQGKIKIFQNKCLDDSVVRVENKNMFSPLSDFVPPSIESNIDFKAKRLGYDK